MIRKLIAAMLVMGLGVSWCGTAKAVSFGMGGNAFDINFVPIGNAGNGNDTHGAGYGGVGYEYQISKTEISWDMVNKANNAGSLGIVQYNDSANPNRPSREVSWNEAAKFVNWLNTSQGYQAAYNFDTAGNFQLWSAADAWTMDGQNLYRNAQAHYFLSSEDEWYKAAYYDPAISGYYDYPTTDGLVPVSVSGGTTPNTAVYGGQSQPANIDNAGGLSAYGTMGQGGNVWEWMESAWDGNNSDGGEVRDIRGGSFYYGDGDDYLRADYRNFIGDPWGESVTLGFRVAAVPERVGVPDGASTVALMMGSITALGFARRRWKVML